MTRWRRLAGLWTLTSTVERTSIVATSKELADRLAELHIIVGQYRTTLLLTADVPLTFDEIALLPEIEALTPKLFHFLKSRTP